MVRKYPLAHILGLLLCIESEFKVKVLSTD